MPTLNKAKKKNKTRHVGENKAKVAKIYNSSNWKKLRNAYLMQNPLCAECLEKGIVTPAVEVHHVIPILSGNDEMEMLELALNPNNLKSLCFDCHHEVHNKKRRGNK